MCLGVIYLNKFINKSGKILDELVRAKKDWIDEFDDVGTDIICEIKVKIGKKKGKFKDLSEAEIDEEFKVLFNKLYASFKSSMKVGANNIEGYVIRIDDLVNEWVNLPYEARNESIKVMSERYKDKIKEISGVKTEFKDEMFKLLNQKIVEIKSLKNQYTQSD